MGIIIRQSLKQTVIAVVALLVGVIAQIFIYTLDESETYGAAQRILAIVYLLYPILLFGIPQALIKFFGTDITQNKGYLGNFLVASIAFFMLFIGVYQLFKPSILAGLEWLELDIQLIRDYGLQIAILILVLMFSKVFSSHMATHRRIVWPNIFDNLWTKIALALVVFLVIQDVIPLKKLSWWIVGYYSCALIGVVIYAAYLGKLDLRYNPSLFKRGRLKNMGRYSAYTGLAVFGSTFATRIDGVMVAGFTDDQLTGVYMLFLFLAGVVDIPSRAVAQISGPIISEANEKGDITEVKKIYSKAANTLLILGLGVFALIFLSISDLFALTGKGTFYGEFFVLFTILGLIKIVPTTFASANQIVLYSKYYRFTLFLALFLGVTNVLLNYYFIKTLFVETPLTGVSLATAISMLAYYAILVIFIRIKFGIHPFRLKMVITILATAICFGVANFIPLTSFAIVNVIIRTIMFSLPFLYIIYRFAVAEDINDIIDQTIQRIKNRDFNNLI